jgi:hypothetical protein
MECKWSDADHQLLKLMWEQYRDNDRIAIALGKKKEELVEHASCILCGLKGGARVNVEETSRNNNITKTHQRSGLQWTYAEDRKLEELLNQRKTLEFISQATERSVRAIESRILTKPFLSKFINLYNIANFVLPSEEKSFSIVNARR